MNCSPCHGRGVKRALDEDGRPMDMWEPCPNCFGHGVVHCCEGDQATPDPESAAGGGQTPNQP